VQPALACGQALQRRAAPLDTKTKELTTLALSVAARCDPCIGLHAKTLAKLMATRENIKETL
jgi:AhpD family alkylhydroperoxidase